jgi:hypothetical protein
MKTYTVIHAITHEVAYQGPHSNVASRKMMKVGAYPAGWIKVEGNLADAKGVAAQAVEKMPHFYAAIARDMQ